MNRVIRQASRIQRRITAPMRVLPDFIIVGGQRCGTTSLYNNLIQHPSIAPAFQKEVHFFDIHFRKGVNWYRAHFPSYLYKSYIENTRRQPLLTGEASPYYMFHPYALKRISEFLPEVKLIALLRNPVERAYSHYQYQVRKGRESLLFEEAIDAEKDRMAHEVRKMRENEDYVSFVHRHFSYLSRGKYADQLEVLMHLFPRNQILILNAEDFNRDAAGTLNQVTAFLGLPSWKHEKVVRRNNATYSDLRQEVRKELAQFFEPHNKRLYQLLGVDFGWD